MYKKSMTDKHSNYLGEMTATAHNTLSLNMALLLLLWLAHNKKKNPDTTDKQAACTVMWKTHTRRPCKAAYVLDVNVTKISVDTCLLSAMEMIWRTMTVAITGHFKVVKSDKEAVYTVITGQSNMVYGSATRHYFYIFCALLFLWDWVLTSVPMHQIPGSPM